MSHPVVPPPPERLGNVPLGSWVHVPEYGDRLGYFKLIEFQFISEYEDFAILTRDPDSDNLVEVHSMTLVTVVA